MTYRLRTPCVAVASCVLVSMRAHGATVAEERKACDAAADTAQDLIDEGSFTSARAQLAICTRAVCAPSVVKDCANWLEDVDKRQPTVLFDAVDGEGRPVDVQSVTDAGGKVMATSLTGRAQAIDPGLYTFVFTLRDGTELRVARRINEAEKGVKIVAHAELISATPPSPAAVTSSSTLAPTAVALAPAQLDATPKPPAIDSKTREGHDSSLRDWGIVGVVVGLGAGALGAILYGVESSEQSSLGCGVHACGATDRTTYGTAGSRGNVGLGVLMGGGAFAVGGVIVWATARRTDASPVASARIEVTPRGLTLAGSF